MNKKPACIDPERRKKLEKEIEKLKKEKNQAYWERNQLVLFLTKQYKSYLCRHPKEDKEWENDFRWIVCVHSPEGQMTWHIHDSERPFFSHLEIEKSHWDGHDLEEKYRRLRKL